MNRSLKRLPTATILLSAVALTIAAPLLERLGITRDLTAAVFLVVVFTGLIVHRILFLSKPLDAVDFLLFALVCLILGLVILKETGVLALPSAVIWVGGAILFVVALGYTSPPDDRYDTTP